jgi:uncharacterized protein DUF3592
MLAASAAAVILALLTGTRPLVPIQWVGATGTIVLSVKLRAAERAASDQFPVYEPCIVYRYEVDGTTYLAELSRQAGGDRRSERDVERLLRRYPEGTLVPIYYARHDPGWSFAPSRDDRPAIKRSARHGSIGR